MTRGAIFYLDGTGQVYRTTEFNGDMYPEGNASEILERFEEGHFLDVQTYKLFTEHFNYRHYRYDTELVRPYTSLERVIDITNNMTDYLYIINESGHDWIIKAGNDTTILKSKTMGVVHYKQVEKLISRTEKQQAQMSSLNLSKKEFVRIIFRLRDAKDLVDQVDELFHNSRENIKNDFCNAAGLQISHETIVIDLLGKLLNDRIGWLEYFIYELDFGRKYEPGDVVDEEGNLIDISTPDKLYDCITKQ